MRSTIFFLLPLFLLLTACSQQSSSTTEPPERENRLAILNGEVSSTDKISMDKKQPFPICLEYNLHGGNRTDERPVGQICANGTKVKVDGVDATEFCTPAQVARTFHGDQWITAEIEVRDDTITHWVNGEKILTFTDPRYDAEHELGKTFIQGNDARVRYGHISLQSNSHPIEFRKIEIMEY